MNNEISINKIIGDIKKTNGNRKYCYNLTDHLSDYAGSIVGWLKATTPNRIDTLVNFAVDKDAELTAALATIEKCREIVGCPEGVDLQDHLWQLAAENVGLRETVEAVAKITESGVLTFGDCIVALCQLREGANQ